MIRLVRTKYPSATILFNTNAILLNNQWQGELIDSGLDELRISLDSVKRERYARIRGVDDLGIVVDNLREFMQLLGQASRPRVSLWLTAMHHNLEELPDLVELAAELGVLEVYAQRLVLFDMGLACSNQSVYGRLREKEELSLANASLRASELGVSFRASGLVSPAESLRGSMAERTPWSACKRLWYSTYITANGNVLPCCISPFSTTDYAGLVLGNAFETGFYEIWNGDRYVSRRSTLFTERPMHPCERCGTCWSL